jgi:hypothetical protein
MSRHRFAPLAWTSLALAIGTAPALAQPTPSTAPSASATGSAAPPPGTPTASGSSKPADGDDPAELAKRKADAKAAFERGLELYQKKLLQAALAEFLASRAAFPNRNATKNAAVCLQSLARFDESLDMFESLLREFPNLPPDDKDLAQKAVAELRQKVGSIEVEDAEPGASVVIDGKERGDFPLVAPIRVAVGTHTIRVLRAGFEPFEAQLDVAGGKTTRVAAKLKALAASGRLRVVEASGKKLEVLVDGALVGITPWEGNVSVGEHVVLLRGDDSLGTEPSSAPVKLGELTTLRLTADILDASLLVKVTPASARVTIDGVALGSGVFEGALKSGAHRVEVRAEGYYPEAKSVSIDRGDRLVLEVALRRDEDASQWKRPSRVVVDVSGGFALAPSLEGQVVGSCSGTCVRGLPLGGLAMAHGSYEFGSGFGLGFGAGFLQLEQVVSGRDARLEPVGLPPLTRPVDDTLRLTGGLVGITGSYHLGERFPALFRLGVGGFIGSLRDDRRPASADPGLVRTVDAGTVGSLYLNPEIHVGYQVSERVELSVAVQALVLFGIELPRWGASGPQAFDLPTVGYSTYASEELLGDVVVAVSPGLAIRAAF